MFSYSRGFCHFHVSISYAIPEHRGRIAGIPDVDLDPGQELSWFRWAVGME